MSRKQRKAATPSQDPQPLHLQEIPLEYPDRSGPKAPTLYDLAAQREAELRAQIPEYEARKRKRDQQAAKEKEFAAPEPSTESEQSEDAFLTALIYGLTLTSVHITLDILTWHQYAQELSYPHLIKRNVTSTLPVATLMVFMFHSPYVGLTRFEWLRQTLFFCAAVGCGLYAVYLSNEGPFLAVMKNVPPVVTMVLWCVLEMGPVASAVSVALVGVGTWWNGWKLF